MEARTRVRWQKLVDSFALHGLAGLQPWDALKANAASGLSSGEAHAVRFLLRVWDPSREWEAGPFDVVDAMRSWDPLRRDAFAAWVADPWWP